MEDITHETNLKQLSVLNSHKAFKVRVYDDEYGLEVTDLLGNSINVKDIRNLHNIFEMQTDQANREMLGKEFIMYEQGAWGNNRWVTWYCVKEDISKLCCNLQKFKEIIKKD